MQRVDGLHEVNALDYVIQVVASFAVLVVDSTRRAVATACLAKVVEQRTAVMTLLEAADIQSSGTTRSVDVLKLVPIVV